MDPQKRRRLGQVFVASGLIMITVAGLFGFGVIPVGQPVRGILTAVLGAAGATEGIVGLRLLGES